MKTTALIPIKARRQCKTRLSRHLSDEQRLDLVCSMLRHVVSVLEAHPAIDSVLVLSPERDAVPAHIKILPDEGTELNSSLIAAMYHPAITALPEDASSQLLIVPADLAELTASDIDSLIAAAGPNKLAIAPSEDRQGTNALCIPRSLLKHFHYSFGDKSFLLHCNESTRLGLELEVVASRGLGFDLDTREDLGSMTSTSMAKAYKICGASS